MGRRRKAREHTLRVLFQLEFGNTEPEKAVAQYWENRRILEEIKEYSSWLIKGIIEHQQEVDKLIQSFSKNWRLSRMALVDRNIMRMAVFELLYETNVAPAIVINEAIEIAKKYSGEEAATFVNGILDAVQKSLKKKNKSAKEKEDV
jgi:N utilization substance protein B